jgi:WD40 repeat protein
MFRILLQSTVSTFILPEILSQQVQLLFHEIFSKSFLGAESGPIRIFDVRFLKCYTASVERDGHQGPVNRVRFSLLGNSYASCSSDGSIKVWDGSSGRCVRTIEKAHGGTEVCLHYKIISLSRSLVFVNGRLGCFCRCVQEWQVRFIVWS